MSESAPEFRPTIRSTAPDAPPIDASIALVAEELVAVEDRLHELLQSTITIIPQVGGHLAFAGGKRFRPLVTLLAARAAGYHDQGARTTIAAVGELLHTATLLHDDVIDGGEYRRGRVSARLAYGNGMAVLTGDFCLARALQAVSALGDLRAVSSMSRAVTRMAEGEVAQLHVAGDFSLDQKRYYMVIDRKTAALIAWCCSLAGLLQPRDCEALGAYGLQLGYAFQITDDVIDYAHDLEQTGKRRGQDLRDGKMTLPLLLACEADATLRSTVTSAFEAEPPMAEVYVATILERVVASGALQQATKIARDHARQAVTALQAVPRSPARDALEQLAHHTVRRCT